MEDLISLCTKVEQDGPFPTSTLNKKQVFALIHSIGMREFYQSQGTNTRVDIKFIIYASDYNNEEIIEYKDKLYKVIRTYQAGLEKIEVTCVVV